MIMHVLVNGVRLFFDVEGASLVPDGPAMRKSRRCSFFMARGNGRSEAGPREAWTLAQWGDNVRVFCDVLGIANLIVLGASFGGMVALAYATRAIPLILQS
jgi:pimeloyl-ACP methyl ester carboxylesterase